MSVIRVRVRVGVMSLSKILTWLGTVLVGDRVVEE